MNSLNNIALKFKFTDVETATYVLRSYLKKKNTLKVRTPDEIDARVHSFCKEFEATQLVEEHVDV